MIHFAPSILKNFTHKKATRLYPARKRSPFAKARGVIAINVDECIFCSKCAVKCPSSCIAVDKKNGRWELDPMACVYCGMCVQVCPTSCLSQEKAGHAPTAKKFTQEAMRPEKEDLKKRS